MECAEIFAIGKEIGKYNFPASKCILRLIKPVRDIAGMLTCERFKIFV